jgi:hypothetical protein
MPPPRGPGSGSRLIGSLELRPGRGEMAALGRDRLNCLSKCYDRIFNRVARDCDGMFGLLPSR